MQSSYKITPIESGKYSEKSYMCEVIDQCPLCKKSINPRFLFGIYDRISDENSTLENFFYCSGCNHTFIGTYESQNADSSYATASLIKTEPTYFVKAEFDAEIQTLSPQFCKIYNQAVAAESSGLDEIAGLGYRKSLEFIIKDFSIYLHPDDEEKIKSMMLSPCINTYIDSKEITTLATRSAWIGNDEAHYVRKQSERDVHDMKKFIQAVVYFIGMYLIAEDAASMEPVK